jgi:hypothetical protein
VEYERENVGVALLNSAREEHGIKDVTALEYNSAAIVGKTQTIAIPSLY